MWELQEGELVLILSSHLFQRVASFLPFLWELQEGELVLSSHLFQRVASFLLELFRNNTAYWNRVFSSLSESGFIPTMEFSREVEKNLGKGSHLFQRVASFLPSAACMSKQRFVDLFSSLSESGFIPTKVKRNVGTV